MRNPKIDLQYYTKLVFIMIQIQIIKLFLFPCFVYIILFTFIVGYTYWSCDVNNNGVQYTTLDTAEVTELLCIGLMWSGWKKNCQEDTKQLFSVTIKSGVA